MREFVGGRFPRSSTHTLTTPTLPTFLRYVSSEARAFAPTASNAGELRDMVSNPLDPDLTTVPERLNEVASLRLDLMTSATAFLTASPLQTQVRTYHPLLRMRLETGRIVWLKNPHKYWILYMWTRWHLSLSTARDTGLDHAAKWKEVVPVPGKNRIQ